MARTERDLAYRPLNLTAARCVREGDGERRWAVTSDDEVAFEAWVQREATMLLRAAYLLTGDRGHAEDLLQVTLERTARHWRRLDGEPTAYARRVLVNLSHDRWRRSRARVAEAPGDGLLAVADGGTSGVLLRRDLVMALRQLPRRQRQVLVLRHLLDLTEAETAAALDVAVGTVKSTGSAAAARLRALIPDLAPDQRSTR